jgi:hypothetical protein
MLSLSPQVNTFCKNAIQTFPTCVFDYRSGQMGTANHLVWIESTLYVAALQSISKNMGSSQSSTHDGAGAAALARTRAISAVMAFTL